MEDEKSRGDCQEEQTEGQIEVREDGRKEPRPRWVNFNIRPVDGHFLATFRHDEKRIFHNMEELLGAIEVEVKRLGGTLGGG